MLYYGYSRATVYFIIKSKTGDILQFNALVSKDYNTILEALQYMKEIGIKIQDSYQILDIMKEGKDSLASYLENQKKEASKMLTITTCLNASLEKQVLALCKQYLSVYQPIYKSCTYITGDICFVEFSQLNAYSTKTICIVIGKHTKEEIYQSTTKHIFGYIRLPFFIEDFKQVCNALYHEIENRFLEYKIQTKNMFASIRVSTISYIESYRHTITIYSQVGAFRERKTLQNFIRDCHSINMIQIHKSYIVNISQCKAMIGDNIELKDGTLLPIGKTYKEKVKNMLEKD